MAWYALYKWFIPWRKTPYINWIEWYKIHLYEEWFNSLSAEDQEAEQNRIQAIKDKRKKDAEQAWNTLNWMYNFIADKCGTDYLDMASKIVSNPRSRYW